MGRAVGLKGEVEVLILSDAPDRFVPGAVLTSGDRTFTIRSVRQQGERTIVAFEGITDRNASESLRGAELTITADLARALDAGEYWDHDLVGAEVVTTDGKPLGEVTDVLHTSANSVLVVGDHLIPLVGEFIAEVLPGKRITIRATPGLLGD